MPAQEEVDEINEFLQKRREKQRLGELPRDDITPNFAKKISLAVFGKPRVEKTPLQSTQPTVVSTQAQAAMRQQLDEIMETHLSNASRTSAPPAAPKTITNSIKPNTPTPSVTLNTSARTPSPANTAASPSPASRVPRYYSNMPYPPYIQRGLANLPKAAPTAAQAAGLSKATNTPLPPTNPATPRTSAWPTPTTRGPVATTPNMTPLSKTPATTPTPATTIAPTPVRAPLTPPTSTMPRTTPILPPGARTIPSARTLPQTPAATSNTPPAPKPSFWKKLFGGKQPSPAPPAPPLAAKTSPPSPYAAAARTTPLAATRNPIEPIAPIPPVSIHANATPLPREKSTDISPVQSKQTSPSLARNEIPSAGIGKTNLPALSPPTPVIIPEKNIQKNAYSTNNAGEAGETKKDFTPAIQPTASTPTVKQNYSPPRTQTPPISSAEKSAPYVPPWVARNTALTPTAVAPAPSAPTPSSSPTTRDTMPWKQPFGTRDQDDALPAREKNNLSTEKESPPLSAGKKTRDMEEDELKVEDADAYAAPESPAHSPGIETAMEQEISEEEALESLPFEDVEGLSASDLDYLSQKEKEHRKAQEEKDTDVGIPSELRSTLQRQSTQLEGALTPNQTPKNTTSDEKQEILRRLKQMMEEEGHS